MGHRVRRSVVSLALGAATSLSLAACQLAPGNARVIYVTQSPPTPEVIYVTQPPTATPRGTAASAATSTRTATAAPTRSAAPTPAPTPASTSEAAFCSGTPDYQAMFLKAARTVKFTVYCATGLPSGWAILTGQWQYNSAGGLLTVAYEYKKTGTDFEVFEGAFCLPTNCTPNPSVYIEQASFGGLSAGLYSDSTGFYVFTGAVGSVHSYALIGGDQDALKGWAAAMRAVPRH
jgi:hypothetical protein